MKKFTIEADGWPHKPQPLTLKQAIKLASSVLRKRRGFKVTKLTISLFEEKVTNET